MSFVNSLTSHTCKGPQKISQAKSIGFCRSQNSDTPSVDEVDDTGPGLFLKPAPSVAVASDDPKTHQPVSHPHFI